MKKYILNPISLFFIGAILGIISKLLDILFVGNLFMMTLGYMFSDLPIWVLLGILISIYSDTKKKAMINIFPFCIGMLISYYVTAELTNAVYSWNFIKGWTIFSCLSPLFAYFTWKTKEEGLFAKFISKLMLKIYLNLLKKPIPTGKGARHIDDDKYSPIFTKEVETLDLGRADFQRNNFRINVYLSYDID
jgi:hypothetical protein